MWMALAPVRSRTDRKEKADSAQTFFTVLRNCGSHVTSSAEVEVGGSMVLACQPDAKTAGSVLLVMMGLHLQTSAKIISSFLKFLSPAIK